MPFGLTNAPASFQQFINEVLREYLDIFMIAYLDDILIFLDMLKEHISHITKTLKRFEQAKLWLKLKKCEFHIQETKFLGHWITTEGIQMEKTKIQAILDWPELQNTKEVQQFIGLINYYHKFLKGYLTIMGPLFKLLSQPGSPRNLCVLVFVTKDLLNTTRPSRLTLLFELAQYSMVSQTFLMINPGWSTSRSVVFRPSWLRQGYLGKGNWMR